MSEQQTYKGRFVSTGKTLEDWVTENEHVLPVTYGYEMETGEKFYEITWQLTHGSSVTPNKLGFFIRDNIVYEIVELVDLQYDSFAEVDWSTGKFVTSFYDGCTDLAEMLEEA